MKTQSQTPSALLLLFLQLLPLPSLSTTSFHFRSQDNYLLTVGPTSPLLSSNPNCTHITAPTSPPNRPLSFSFPLSSPGPHLLRLHLLPSSSDHPVSASASSFPLLTRFSPSTATVDPTAKEFLFPNLRLPSLPLSLSPASSVSSVELYSVPAGLVPSAGGEGHVLEVVHRVNVGGPRVTPDNDTLWRTWEVDEGYYVGGEMGREARFLGRLNWAEGGATPDTAPETVYGTCREMGIRGNLMAI